MAITFSWFGFGKSESTPQCEKDEGRMAEIKANAKNVKLHIGCIIAWVSREKRHESSTTATSFAERSYSTGGAVARKDQVQG
jgi:hypothetical protein